MTQNKPAKTPLAKRILFWGVLLLLILGLAELGARAAFWVKDIPMDLARQICENLRDFRVLYPKGLGKYVPHPYLGYHRRPGYDRQTDGWGMQVFGGKRNPGVGPELRVMCLGGSTTESPYPGLLYRDLAAKLEGKGVKPVVINGGTAAWTSVESLINLALRGVEYAPDVVVVYHAYNDVYPSCADNFSPDYAHWRTPMELGSPTLFDRLPNFMFDSAAVLALDILLSQRYARRVYMGVLGVTTKAYPDFAGCKYQGRLTFARNLSSIIALARGYGMKVLLVTQALRRADYPRPMDDALLKEAKAHNHVVREVARGHPGVMLLDFAGMAKGREKEIITGDMVHLTGAGYQSLAAAIADKLLAQPWLSGPDR